MRISGDRINDIGRSQPGRVEPRRVDGQRVEETAPGTHGRTDAVEMTSYARDIQVAAQSVGDVPQARRQRIAELAERVRSGRYEVGAAQIAARMLGEEAEG